MPNWDHDDLKSKGLNTTVHLKPHLAPSPLHPMQPYYDDKVAPALIGPTIIVNPDGSQAEYRPTLPPVAHDPLNMRGRVDLQSLYPKLADLAAVNAATWGALIVDPIERALRKELQTLHSNAVESLKRLQDLMNDQRAVQEHFNEAYGAIETILAKFPELLKP